MADDTAQQIEPDTKDWTWVLEKTCPECGVSAGELSPLDVIAAVPAQVDFWQAALREPGVGVRRRAGQWSVVEYACHMRDVYQVFTDRVRLILERDDPTFADWDQDRAAAEGDYGAQEPQTVARQLRANAEQFAGALAGVRPGQWSRAGLRSNGSQFTLTTLVQYFAHDEAHHEHDVRPA